MRVVEERKSEKGQVGGGGKWPKTDKHRRGEERVESPFSLMLRAGAGHRCSFAGRQWW